MKINTQSDPLRTHEGAIAPRIPPIDQLRRTVLACLLWEDNFYESGLSVSARIANLIKQCSPDEVAALAAEARLVHHLRHVPLLLARELARDSQRCRAGLIASLLETIIQRPDELTEFLAIYWKNGRVPISKQVKKGLAQAFCKFDEYRLAKYNRDAAIKLRDVLFMVHAKPRDAAQAALWKRLVENKLAIPDTWEVALSAGGNAKQVFERLLRENKLGYLALLRNLRNMRDAGVEEALIKQRLLSGAVSSKALPFRFLAAARAVSQWEPWLDEAMQLATAGLPKLPGSTVLLVDVSGSMIGSLSSRSDLRRCDAAAALAILMRGICEDCQILVFNKEVREIPPRKGMALADAIGPPTGGTDVRKAVTTAWKKYPTTARLIVLTDEQSATRVPQPPIGQRAYMVNVANCQNGVGYGDWLHINGFSEAVVQYILAIEQMLDE